jgi:hypothetical protein
MLTSGTQLRGFEPGRSRRIFRGEKILSMPSFGGEVKPSVPCRRFVAFVGKSTSYFSPTVPLSLLEVSRVVVDVGAPGGAGGNFQSRASTISLKGCGTSGDVSYRGPIVEDKYQWDE